MAYHVKLVVIILFCCIQLIAANDVLGEILVVENSEQSGEYPAKFTDIQIAIDRANPGDTIALKAGSFSANPTFFSDELCGNCPEHQTEVKASRGFIIENKALTLVGAGIDKTILFTNAGYGIYIENSTPVHIVNLKITGGIRDADGNATDAGIVVRNSRVVIENCAISGNIHRDSSAVVGIGGIFGREGAELIITDNLIDDNGWDGIALYRGATAFIADNIIRKGRGAGVGITWDAKASIIRNKVSEYWKGIGSFGDSRVIACDNEVFDNLGWGIIATGTSWMDAANNAVIRNGNCGMAIWGTECRGRFTNNLVVENGWRKEWVCPCVGIWNYSGEDSSLLNDDRLKTFEISYNNIWKNRAGEYEDIPDLTGRFGNISSDPEFANPSDSTDFRVKQTSPLRNAGNPLITDPDGSRSDIGLVE